MKNCLLTFNKESFSKFAKFLLNGMFPIIRGSWRTNWSFELSISKITWKTAFVVYLENITTTVRVLGLVIINRILLVTNWINNVSPKQIKKLDCRITVYDIQKNTLYIFHKYIPSTTIRDYYLSESQLLITKDKITRVNTQMTCETIFTGSVILLYNNLISVL